jgi:LmbE family N-acetylglucosaminyl deacetylase
MQNLLAIFAHPDDETFSLGGTIAKYAKADWKVELVCATRGEAGDLGPYAENENVNLGNLRQKELEAAAKFLGCHSVTFMDFKDGKMTEASPGDIEDKLTQLMIVHKPDVIVTFDPTGISNHPDHVRLSLAATYAFQVYAKLRHKDKPNDERPPKLYYVCMPESVASYLKKNDVIPAEAHEKPWTGVNDRLISNVIDIKRFAAIKKKALRLHVSQQRDVERFISFDKNPIFRQEYLVLRMIGINEAFMGKYDVVSDRL